MDKNKLNSNFNQKEFSTNFKKLKKNKKLKYLKNIVHLYISEIKSKNLFYKIEESQFEINFKAKLILDKNRDFSDKEIIELCKFICFLEKSKRNILDHLDLNDNGDKKFLDHLNEEVIKEMDLNSQNNNKIKIGFKTSS